MIAAQCADCCARCGKTGAPGPGNDSAQSAADRNQAVSGCCLAVFQAGCCAAANLLRGSVAAHFLHAGRQVVPASRVAGKAAHQLAEVLNGFGLLPVVPGDIAKSQQGGRLVRPAFLFNLL